MADNHHYGDAPDGPMPASPPIDMPLDEQLRLIQIAARHLGHETIYDAGIRAIATQSPELGSITTDEYGVIMYEVASEPTSRRVQLTLTTSEGTVARMTYPPEMLAEPTAPEDPAWDLSAT